MRIIRTRAELVALAKELGVRPDWHEPDEQDVTAEVYGNAYNFDNAMAPGESYGRHNEHAELHVVLRHYNDTMDGPGEKIAVVNLATLFAWATGYDAPPPLVDVSPKELESLKVAQLRGQVQALQELLRALRPTIEAGTKTQWGAALRDLDRLVPKD